MSDKKLEEEYPWLAGLEPIVKFLVQNLYKKERSYRGSWQKRGGVGAFMMLARKWDRIEGIAEAHGYDILKALDSNEGDVQDDVEDLLSYLLLVLAKHHMDMEGQG